MAGRLRRTLSLPLPAVNPCYILNPMVQYSWTGFDASFAALPDATRRGVLEQLGRTNASITDLAEKFLYHSTVVRTSGTWIIGTTCCIALPIQRRLGFSLIWLHRYDTSR
jgi:hypothetical protein